MKLIYVAGPYSAPTEYEVGQNIREAEALALEVWKTKKAAAVCPHMNTAHWGGVLSHADFIAGDLEIISRCDAILLMPKWESSKGARQEYQFAMDNGIFVFYTLEALIGWINNNMTGPMEDLVTSRKIQGSILASSPAPANGKLLPSAN